MTCKGICHRHKVIKHGRDGRYDNGHKRCSRCDVFIKWEGIHCPCCGYKLRISPRTKKAKAKFRARMGLAQQQEIICEVPQ